MVKCNPGRLHGKQEKNAPNSAANFVGHFCCKSGKSTKVETWQKGWLWLGLNLRWAKSPITNR